MAVGAVHVEQDPVALVEAQSLPLEGLEGASADGREEGVVAPHFLHEHLQRGRVAALQARTPFRELVHRQRAEHDVARHRHHRAQHVDQFGRRVVGRQHFAVGVEVEGDHRQRAVRVDLAPHAHRLDVGARPGLGMAAQGQAHPVARADCAGALDHGREFGGAQHLFLDVGQRHPGPGAGGAAQHGLRFLDQDHAALARPALQARPPLAFGQRHQARAAVRRLQAHHHRLAHLVHLAVEHLGAAGALQQPQRGRGNRAPPREAAGLVEHARGLFAAHADDALHQQAGAEDVGTERVAAVADEAVAFVQERHGVVEAGRLRHGAVDGPGGRGGRRGRGRQGGHGHGVLLSPECARARVRAMCAGARMAGLRSSFYNGWWRAGAPMDDGRTGPAPWFFRVIPRQARAAAAREPARRSMLQ